MQTVTVDDVRGNLPEHVEKLTAEHEPLKVCRILKEMQRDDPARGLGKPEQLKHNLSGLWSRQLSQKDRVVYRSWFNSPWDAR